MDNIILDIIAFIIIIWAYFSFLKQIFSSIKKQTTLQSTCNSKNCAIK